MVFTVKEVGTVRWSGSEVKVGSIEVKVLVGLSLLERVCLGVKVCKKVIGFGWRFGFHSGRSGYSEVGRLMSSEGVDIGYKGGES